MVWLDAWNLATECLSKKLSNKFEGLFQIIYTVSTHACKLDILIDWRHHDVFGNYLLRLAATDPLPGQLPPPPLPMINTAGLEEFEVEQIINSRMHRGQLEFLVQWIGYDRPTYQLFDDVKDATEAMNNYFWSHPTAVGCDTWANHLTDEDSNGSLYDDHWGFAGALP